MLEYASWGIFVLSFLLSYSLLAKVFLSREEKELMSSIFGSTKKNINKTKKNKSKTLKKKKLSKKRKNKKRNKVLLQK